MCCIRNAVHMIACVRSNESGAIENCRCHMCVRWICAQSVRSYRPSSCMRQKNVQTTKKKNLLGVAHRTGPIIQSRNHMSLSIKYYYYVWLWQVCRAWPERRKIIAIPSLTQNVKQVLVDDTDVCICCRSRKLFVVDHTVCCFKFCLLFQSKFSTHTHERKKWGKRSESVEETRRDGGSGRATKKCVQIYLRKKIRRKITRTRTHTHITEPKRVVFSAIFAAYKLK